MQIIDPTEYFDKIKGYRNVVLFGCGGKGRQAVEIFDELGVRITAACDNNEKLWGKEFLPNILIRPFSQIAMEISEKDTCFVITSTILNAIEIQKQIRGKCSEIDIYHFCNPFKVERNLITHDEILSNEDKLNLQYRLLEDDTSKKIFIETINSKLTGNMLSLLEFTSGREIYTFFDQELVPVNDNSVYLDVGAYTGDTIQSFLMFSGGNFKKIIGVEADKGNFSALSKFVQFGRVPNIEIYNTGLWDEEENRAFYSNEINDVINYDSPNLFLSVEHLADNLSLSKMKDSLKRDIIHLETLDGITKEVVPDIIKINALAADSHIIKGGARMIAEKKPILIFEFGVMKNDVFSMILDVKRINSKYRFYLRRKKVFGDIKTVVYCI